MSKMDDTPSYSSLSLASTRPDFSTAEWDVGGIDDWPDDDDGDGGEESEFDPAEIGRIVVEGLPMNTPWHRPLDGFIIDEAGRDGNGDIYVLVRDAWGDPVRLSAARSDDARKLAITERLLDVKLRHSRERELYIDELRSRLAEANARIAELTRTVPEPDWTQPAEVAAMGRPRSVNRFNW